MLSTIIVITLVLGLIYFRFIAPKVTRIEIAVGYKYNALVWFTFFFLFAITCVIFGWYGTTMILGFFAVFLASVYLIIRCKGN